MIDNISKLRTVQLELLEAFANTCDAHGLKWYVFFGTLLGVMRHDGYLPWDDDVDVAMPMEDYRTLCAHPEWFDAGRFTLQTPLDDGNSRYAHLRKNNTTAFREDLITELRKGGHHGIFIDIIPLAEIPGTNCYHTPVVYGKEKQEAVYPKAWFEPSGKGIFEQMAVRLPALPRKVLTEVYKTWDWPNGVRESRPVIWFADTEHGYEQYVRRYTGMLEDIEGKTIYLFGAADSLRIWLERFELGKQVVCTFDNDPGKWGRKVYGKEVRDPSELPGMIDQNSRVIIVSLWHQEIGKQLEKMGIRDYYVFLDQYYDEKVGNKVKRREDMPEGGMQIPLWKG
ncbi:MAG: LicD family protein [Lachnospiraceae bacterium]|nr:LicD family protein [Lachnospiraceae bacterium]